MRADQYVATTLGISRSRSSDLIKRGLVSIIGILILECDTLIYGKPAIEIKDETHINKVGRGYEKLQFAAKHFQIHFENSVCLDIGASTGGFTQYMHEKGAKLVISVDIGTNQIHESLKKISLQTSSHKIEIHEGQDIRTFTTSHGIDYITCDVSFISIHQLLEHFKRLCPKGIWIILFKPQFEVGKEVNKTGIVTNMQAVERIFKSTLNAIADTRPDAIIEQVTSHIKGGDGNTEYWIYVHN